MRHALTVLAALACFAIARPAAAQFVTYDTRPEFVFLTTTTSSAVVVGVIMLTVVNVRKDPGTVQRYLDDNQPSVRAALSLGAGTVVEDLAQIFGVRDEDLGTFAALLRRHRGALSQAAFIDRDPSRFIRLVDEAIALDPRIRQRT